MTEEKKGNTFIIAELILWSLFPILSILGLKGLPAIVSLFWVSSFAALFFLGLMLWRGKWSELRNPKVWLYTSGVVLFICVIFYGFYFYGLTKTSAANGAIAGLFEIVPTYIYFQLYKKEKFRSLHVLGIVFAVTGALIVLLPKAGGGVNVGDLIILLGTFFPPIGNWYQQKVRKIASTETILFLRHILAVPVLAIILLFLGYNFHIQEVGDVWIWLALNGIFVFGISKIFWVEAIHRMSVTKAIAFGGLSPVFTVLFAWIILHQTPTETQLLALPLLIGALWILTDMPFRKNSAKVDI